MSDPAKLVQDALDTALAVEVEQLFAVYCAATDADGLDRAACGIQRAVALWRALSEEVKR